MNSRKKSFDCYLTDQGKVTIPKHIREKYNLSPDTKMKFVCEPNGIFIKILDDAPEQIRIDQLDAVKTIVERTRNRKAPVNTLKLHTDKCSLCGCLSGLELHDGAAYCKTCYERKKDFDKQFDLVKKACKQVRAQNAYKDVRGEKYKHGI